MYQNSGDYGRNRGYPPIDYRGSRRPPPRPWDNRPGPPRDFRREQGPRDFRYPMSDRYDDMRRPIRPHFQPMFRGRGYKSTNDRRDRDYRPRPRSPPRSDFKRPFRPMFDKFDNDRPPPPSMLSTDRRRPSLSRPNDVIHPRASILKPSINIPKQPLSDESDESDDDDYNQDEIEHQIDHIDNEIAQAERQLATVRSRKIAQLQKEADDNKPLEHLPDLLLQDFRARYIQSNPQELKPDESIVDSIYKENKTLVKEFSKRLVERQVLLTTEEPIDVCVYPNQPVFVFSEQDVENHQKVRYAIQKTLLRKWTIRNKREEKLVKKYDVLVEKWQAKEQTIRSPTPPLDPKVSLKKSGFRSDVVRTDAEWQNVLMFLGLSNDNIQRLEERAIPDPPMIFDAAERKAQTFYSTNGLVHDPASQLADYNSNMETKWSQEEKDIFRLKLIQFGKDFYKISSFLPLKDTQDCVHYYYKEKINLRFKSLLTRGRGRRRKERLENEIHYNPFKTYLLDPDEEIIPIKNNNRPEEEEEEEDEEINIISPITAPVEPTELKPEAKLPTPEKKERVKPEKVIKEESEGEEIEHEGWTQDEIARANRAIELFGRDFDAVAMVVSSKTPEQCKAFYNNQRRKKDKAPTPTLKEKKKEKRRKKNKSEDNNEEEEILVTDAETSQQSTKKKKEEESRKRRKKEMDEENNRKTISYWSVSERSEFLKLYEMHGTNWEEISKALGTKSAIQVRNYYQNSKSKLGLDEEKYEASESAPVTMSYKVEPYPFEEGTPQTASPSGPLPSFNAFTALPDIPNYVMDPRMQQFYQPATVELAQPKPDPPYKVRINVQNLVDVEPLVKPKEKKRGKSTDIKSAPEPMQQQIIQVTPVIEPVKQEKMETIPEPVVEPSSSEPVVSATSVEAMPVDASVEPTPVESSSVPIEEPIASVEATPVESSAPLEEPMEHTAAPTFVEDSMESVEPTAVEQTTSEETELNEEAPIEQDPMTIDTSKDVEVDVEKVSPIRSATLEDLVSVALAHEKVSLLIKETK